MKYRPWKGISLILIGVIVDILLQLYFGRGQGVAGIPTAVGVFSAWGWTLS